MTSRAAPFEARCAQTVSGRRPRGDGGPWRRLWLVLAGVAGVCGAQVETAEVRIDAGAEVTVVEASYRVGEAVSFRARRFPGQELRMLTHGLELRRAAALAWFDAGGSVDVRYEVRGARERIPLFVPDAPVAGPVEIRLRGLGGDRDLRGGFPRLEPAPDGALAARPADLPSFVRLPPPRGGLSVHRLAEYAVVALVGLATGFRIVRRRE